MKMIKEALNLKVEKINEYPSTMGNQYKIGEYTVRIFKKPGRTMFTCNCFNGTRFCNSPTLCKHKIATIKFMIENEKK